MKASEPIRSRRGRPKAFDVERALDGAMRTFWRYGYEGASLPELTRAMGINRPSLYATFGNKQSLFRKAVERYVERGRGPTAEAMRAPTARAAAERLLRGAVAGAGAGGVRGCLLVQGALCCGKSATAAKRELASRRAAVTQLLRERFERAAAEGERLPGGDPLALGRFVSAVLHGIAVQSAGGAGRDELAQVVDLAMRAFADV